MAGTSKVPTTSKDLLKSGDMWIQEAAIHTIKRNITEAYLKDIFEILEKGKNNPLLATAVMLRENKATINSFWINEFKTRFPKIAKSYL